MSKLDLKYKAIKLRQDGLTYSEILQEVPVAKSTISLWLKSVGLSSSQVQRITEKRILAAKKGGLARRNITHLRKEEIKSMAKADIQAIGNKELFLIGVTLYWAEGAKEKNYKAGSPTMFSNSDPLMIKVFICWLRNCLEIGLDRIKFDIYIHDSYRNKVEEVRSYWSIITGFDVIMFDKIYFKRSNIRTKRRNSGNNYYGLLRVRVKHSSELNRKIAGWIEGISINCGIV